MTDRTRIALVRAQPSAETLKRASIRGNEYAWPIEDIPNVIEAARASSLVNIGGQLQFRLPDDGPTCECFWVDVDTYKSVEKTLDWDRRVALTADAALRDFHDLQARFDFIAEGWTAFKTYLTALVDEGRDPADSACFVWYVLSEAEARTEGL